MAEAQYDQVVSMIIHEIEDKDFRNEYRIKPTAFTRNRHMNFAMVCRLILDRNRKSISNKIKENPAFMDIPATRQAFCKARQLIDPKAFKSLHEKAVRMIYLEDAFKSGLLEVDSNGFIVIAIDGIRIPLPNLPSFQREFTCIGAGEGSPTALGSTAYDIYNHIYLDASINKEMDERKAALAHVNKCLELCPHMREFFLFVFDRGYISKAIVDDLTNLGAKYIFRVREGFSKEIDEMKGNEIRLKIGVHEVRCVKVRIYSRAEKKHITEKLVTNCDTLTPGDLGEYYGGRWQVELSYHDIKSKFEICNFSGFTWPAVQQDFYGTCLVANILKLMVNVSDVIVKDVRKDKNNKYEYKTNINHAVGVFVPEFASLLCEPDPEERSRRLAGLLLKMTTEVVQIRPGRYVERPPNGARKVRFHHNQKSNV